MEALGGIGSSIGAAFAFATVISSLLDVPDEARRISSLLERVRKDRNETLRLLLDPAVKARFAVDPGVKSYVENCIIDMEENLRSIAKFVEKIRVKDANGLRIDPAKRVEWLWKHKSRVETAYKALDTCHQSLISSNERMDLWITNARTLAAQGPAPPPYQENGGTYPLPEKTPRPLLGTTKTKTRANEGVQIQVTPVIPTPDQRDMTEPFPRVPTNRSRLNPEYSTSRRRVPDESNMSRDPSALRSSFRSGNYREDFAASQPTLSPPSLHGFDRPRPLSSSSSMISVREEEETFSTPYSHSRQRSVPANQTFQNDILRERQARESRWLDPQYRESRSGDFRVREDNRSEYSPLQRTQSDDLPSNMRWEMPRLQHSISAPSAPADRHDLRRQRSRLVLGVGSREHWQPN